MKRRNDGMWLEFETKVGYFSTKETDHDRSVTVTTNGEYRRVVEIASATGLIEVTPKAARRLAKLLMKAADVAEAEDKKIAKQDLLIGEDPS